MKREKIEKVLIVIDGDNFKYFFGHIDKPINEIVEHFAGNRLIARKPKYFASYYVAPSPAEDASDLDQLAFKIQNLNYFDLELTQIKKYFEPFFVFSINLPITDKAPVKKRGYGDSEVCVHVFANLKKFNTLMLFANDKHFAAMNTHLRYLGKRVELYSPVGTINKKLVNSCDSITIVSQVFPITYKSTIIIPEEE